jgi:hypothetical protein
MNEFVVLPSGHIVNLAHLLYLNYATHLALPGYTYPSDEGTTTTIVPYALVLAEGDQEALEAYLRNHRATHIGTDGQPRSGR